MHSSKSPSVTTIMQWAHRPLAIFVMVTTASVEALLGTTLEDGCIRMPEGPGFSKPSWGH
ncbi:MAG: hypothetical protein EB033_05700 [Proteobacteria bacterium]|nr:hypothetical protein [Pseudomonadota bacterium]NDB72005.1 hypothetical protein [Pseudomonadota bacterium]NDF08695.1 hypothetical protein [Pseudomonadota bacterium]